MMIMGDIWSQLGPSLATLMFIWTLYQNYFPDQLRTYIITHTHKIYCFFYPYIHITFHQFENEELFNRSKVFLAIERYLSYNSSHNAKRLVAKGVSRDSTQPLVLRMDNHEEVTDVFEGIKVWWSSYQNPPSGQTISFLPREEERRFFQLKFHRKNRDIITRAYLKHVLDEGEAIAWRDKKRKLYTNNDDWWSHVIFNHPSNFNTLAMEPTRKQNIMEELINFSKSKEYYAKIGKAWKRGYLLHGPPGTGKSSMIAAMANLLQYDVYDLELTGVKDNRELKKLLIGTSGKSIIVIEDIDCSLDLTGQRKEKKKDDDEEKEEKNPIKKEIEKKKKKKKGCEVTLSGLLNVIDGLWSAIGEERIIVFTTNYLEKLDPALIRRGRMDNHIELSYCCFEAFKVLANNYLDVECHELFPEIKRLLGEVKITPADVAENLMPKSTAGEKPNICLKRLIKSLEDAKEEARLKAEEEERIIKAAKEEEDIKKEDTMKAENLVKENGDTKKSDAMVKENGEIKNEN